MQGGALDITPKATAGTISLVVDSLTPADAQYAGGKAANFGFLRRSIPTNSPVAGHRLHLRPLGRLPRADAARGRDVAARRSTHSWEATPIRPTSRPCATTWRRSRISSPTRRISTPRSGPRSLPPCRTPGSAGERSGSAARPTWRTATPSTARDSTTATAAAWRTISTAMSGAPAIATPPSPTNAACSGPSARCTPASTTRTRFWNACAAASASPRPAWRSSSTTPSRTPRNWPTAWPCSRSRRPAACAGPRRTS